MQLIIDDRERAVVPYLAEYSGKTHIDYKIQRNEVGDYAITYLDYILLVIERKTWTDLSASFRDGRKENVNKLLELRERTGCQIAYLIEGNATPPSNYLYGRIPVKNLRAHLDHLAIRDGIHMLYSKDEKYTAERLFELCANFITEKNIIKQIKQVSKEGGEETKDLLKIDMGVAVSYVEQILRCLPGVGSIISTVLAENNITLYGLYKEQYTVDDIAKLKYQSGSMIGVEKAKKITQGTVKLINSKSQANQKIHAKILMTVPLISKKAAEVILQHTTLALILDKKIDIDLLANIEKAENKKLGQKAASNIVEHLIGSTEYQEETKEEFKEEFKEETKEEKKFKKPILAKRKPIQK